MHESQKFYFQMHYMPKSLLIFIKFDKKGCHMKIHIDIYIIINNNKKKKGLIIKRKGKNNTKSYISSYFTR